MKKTSDLQAIWVGCLRNPISSGKDAPGYERTFSQNVLFSYRWRKCLQKKRCKGRDTECPGNQRWWKHAGGIASWPGMRGLCGPLFRSTPSGLILWMETVTTAKNPSGCRNFSRKNSLSKCVGGRSYGELWILGWSLFAFTLTWKLKAFLDRHPHTRSLLLNFTFQLWPRF